MGLPPTRSSGSPNTILAKRERYGHRHDEPYEAVAVEFRRYTPPMLDPEALAGEMGRLGRLADGPEAAKGYRRITAELDEAAREVGQASWEELSRHHFLKESK